MNKTFFLFSLLVLFSCSPDNRSHRKYICGYSYEWKDFENNEPYTISSDSAYAYMLSLVAYDHNFSILWKPTGGLWQPFVVPHNGYFKKTFCILKSFRTNDSIHVFMPLNDFAYDWVLNKPKISDSVITLAVKILRIFNQRAWELYTDSIRNIERLMLDSIMQKKNYYRDSTGILSNKKLESKHENYSPDGVFEITYGCRTLKGILLDSTYDPVYIQHDDLGRSYFIKSINYVIKRISLNDTVKFILPSHLAFGEKGFYSIVPPNTPLEYTLIKKLK